MESKKPKKTSNVVTLQNKDGFSTIAKVKNPEEKDQKIPKKFSKKSTKKPSIKKHSGPVRIGVADPEEGWRCKICKYLNKNEENECKMCSEEKQIMKEKFVDSNINKNFNTKK